MNRRLLRHALLPATVLVLVCVAGPPPPATATPRRLTDVQRQLDDARGGLGAAMAQKHVALAEVDRIDARRAALEHRLAALDGELGQAERALAAAQASVDTTTRRLLATQQRLSQARAALAGERAVLARRARAAYAHLPFAGVLRHVDEVSDVARSMKYVRVALAADRARVARTTALQREIVAARRESDQQHARERHARRRAAAQRDEAARVVAEQAEVTVAATAQAQRHRHALAAVEADAVSYRALVAALEAESAQLEAQLRAEASAAAAAAAATGAPAGGARHGGEAVAALIERHRLQWPSDGTKTSDFGWRTHPIFGDRRFHVGIDIAGQTGAPIFAAGPGVITAAGVRGGYGNTTLIDHGEGLVTLYAHQSRFHVTPGTRVVRGQVIGAVGSTGYSTGPHLHFEVRVEGAPVDPMRWFAPGTPVG